MAAGVESGADVAVSAPLAEVSGDQRADASIVPLHGKQAQGPQREKHSITSLDGVRAVAILLVLFCHIATLTAVYHPQMGPDWLYQIATFGAEGVFLFFALSGFLLFLPYARALTDTSGATPWPSARRFYQRRALRILPLYLFALAVLVLFDQHGALLVQPDGWRTLLLSVFMLHDMTRSSFDAVSAQFWTLAVEWQYYLVLPGIAWVLWRMAGRSSSRGFYVRLGFGLLTLIAAGLWVRWLAATLYYGDHLVPVESPFPLNLLWMVLYGVKGKYLEAFALGFGASIIYVLVVERARLSHRLTRWLGLGLLVLAVAGLAGCFFWQLVDHRYWIWSGGEGWQVLGEWSTTLAFTCLLLAVLLGPRILGWFFALRPLRFIGDISYSMYVWHYTIITVLAARIASQHPTFGYPLTALASVLAVVVFSTASYYLIERPVMQYRQRRNQ